MTAADARADDSASSSARAPRALAAAVFAAALILRAWFLWRDRGNAFSAPPIVDAREYHAWALSILQGRGPLGTWAAHSPLYPLFLAAVYGAFGVRPASVFVLQALIGSTSALLTFLTAWNALRRPLAATAAGLLAGAAWPLVCFTHELLPPVLEMFFVCAGLWLLGGGRTPARAAAAGAALGAACSMRPQLFPAAAALAAFVGERPPAQDRRATAAFLAPLAAWALGWNAYLAAHGIPAMVQPRAGFNLYIANHEGATGKALDYPGLEAAVLRRSAAGAASGPDADRAALAQVLRWVSQRPAEAARSWGARLGLTVAAADIPAGDVWPWAAEGRFPWLRRLDFGVILAAGLPGLVLAAGRGGFARGLLVFLAAGFLSLSLGPAAARYRAPLLPALCLAAAYTAAAAQEAPRARRLGFVLVALLVAAASARLGRGAGVSPEREYALARALRARAGSADADAARTMLEARLAAHPDDWEALWSLATLRIRARDWSGARAAFDRLADARGKDWPLLDAIDAWLCALNGDAAGARARAERARREDPASLESCLRASLYARWDDPSFPVAASLCRCAATTTVAARRESADLVDAFARAQGTADLQTALLHVEERFWAPVEIDYPADDLRRELTRRRWPRAPLSCPR